MSMEIIVHDSFGNQYKSTQEIVVKVEQPEPEVMTGSLRINPDILGKYSIMIIQRSDNMFFPNIQIQLSLHPIHGPFTESQIDKMKVL